MSIVSFLLFFSFSAHAFFVSHVSCDSQINVKNIEQSIKSCKNVMRQDYQFLVVESLEHKFQYIVVKDKSFKDKEKIILDYKINFLFEDLMGDHRYKYNHSMVLSGKQGYFILCLSCKEFSFIEKDFNGASVERIENKDEVFDENIKKKFDVSYINMNIRFKNDKVLDELRLHFLYPKYSI